MHRSDRRSFLTAAGILLAAGLPLPSFAQSGPRLAAIDWAMLETAVALGHMPVAACELIRFRADAVEPRIPADVVDLGLRGAPNFELLQLTRSDLILTSPFYAGYQHRLTPLAPVLSLPFFDPGQPPLPKAMAALHDLSAAIGDPVAATRAETQAEAAFDLHRTALADYADRPVCLIDIGDARHMRVFGFDSLFGNTLTHLGLSNAWGDATAFSFLAPVPIDRLAGMPDARLVIVGDIPPQARYGLERSILWRMLPAVAGGRLYRLPRMNAFGAILSSLRFARHLADAFAAGPIAAI